MDYTERRVLEVVKETIRVHPEKYCKVAEIVALIKKVKREIDEQDSAAFGGYLNMWLRWNDSQWDD